MALQHGSQAAFDLSKTDSNKVTLRYGVPVSGIGLINYLLAGVQRNLHGFSQGLRRYIVRYNNATKSYEHVETQSTFRALYEDHDKINDSSLANCLQATHGSGISEPMPTGLLQELPKIFDQPVLGQNMFIDCVTKVLSWPDEEDLGGWTSGVINTPYITRISRFGVLKEGEVAYFKNCINVPKGFWQRTDGGDPFINQCVSPPALGACTIGQTVVSGISQKQCNKMGGSWT